jgi:Bacterial protein of unknown function (DUF924)
MSGRKFRFGGWVFDPESGDLEREGTRTRLQEQPGRVLGELLKNAGDIVTREHMIGLLWPKGVVDDDQAIAVRLIEALGDQSWTRYARAHQHLIELFGRFPHRNAILGRASTVEEMHFLKEHRGFS